MNLQNRLRTLSSGLVGLRNCIHDQQQNNGASTMDVAVTMADNGLNRISDSGQPNLSLNSDVVPFVNPANDGGGLINGNGAMFPNASVPPMTTCSATTLTSSTTGFHENGINHGTQHQPQSHQFIHGKFFFHGRIRLKQIYGRMLTVHKKLKCIFVSLRLEVLYNFQHISFLIVNNKICIPV